MRSVKFYDTERFQYTDMNEVSYQFWKFYHEVFAREFFIEEEGFLNLSFLPTRVDANTIQLARGIGYQVDSSPAADEVEYGPLVNVEDTNVTVPTTPSGGDRYDIYCIQLKKDEAYVQESRDYRASANDPVTSSTTDVVVGYSYTGAWTSGSLGGGIPAVPAGYLHVATVFQTDGVGIAAASDVVDARAKIGNNYDVGEYTGIANNQTSPTNVVGLSFSSAAETAVKLTGMISISATASFSLGFEAHAWYDGSQWNIACDLFENTVSGMELSITAAGQVQYKSGNYSGFSSGKIKWKSLLIGV